MRMEELSNNQFAKNPDSVERYLLNIVQEYFKNDNVANLNSKEYIIKRALRRMQEEVNWDEIGVLSIDLPNGESRIGAVSLTLEDLNGEPFIAEKHSAFNVDFGTTKNTACEGNDKRLSDKRQPLPHTHTIEDIYNLSSELSTLRGLLSRPQSHTHSNYSVLEKLTYSGTSSSIDLIKLETLTATLDNKISTTIQQINDCTREFDTYKASVNTQIQNTSSSLTDLQTYINTQKDAEVETLKQYVDTKVSEAVEDLSEKLSDIANPEDVQALLPLATNVNTYIGQISVDIQDILQTGNGLYRVQAADELMSEILTKNPNSVITNYFVRGEYWYDGCKYNLPYISFIDNGVLLNIQMYTKNYELWVKIDGDLGNIVYPWNRGVLYFSYYSTQEFSV